MQINTKTMHLTISRKKELLNFTYTRMNDRVERVDLVKYLEVLRYYNNKITQVGPTYN